MSFTASAVEHNGTRLGQKTMRVRALLKRVTLLRSRSALSATLPPISGRGRFFGQKNTLRGRPSGRRPPARQKAAHIWRDRDRLHTCRGNRARAPGRKPPQPSRVEARTQIRHAASPGEGARGWGSERASHHMGLGAAASASGAVEPMRSLPLGTAALDSLCHLDLAGECTGQTAFLLDHHHPGPG